MSGWRRRLRRLRRWVGYTLATLIILAGVAVALLSQLLPLVQARPGEVAAWLQRRVGVPVAVDSAQASWIGRGIRLELGGLRFGTENGLSIDRAALQLNVFAGLLPGVPLTSLQVASPRIEARRNAAGAWQLEGVGLAAGGSIDPRLIERLGELVLDGAVLRLRDPARGIDWTLPRVDARLRTQGGRVRAGVLAYQDTGAPLRINLDADTALREARLYLAGPGNDLAPWLREWLPDDWVLPQVDATFEGWLRFVEGRLDAARWRARIDGRPLAAISGAVASAGPAQPLPTLALQGDWQRAPGGWRLTLAETDAAAGWLHLQHAGGQYQLAARDWQLQRWLRWLAQHPQWDAARRASLQARAIGGRIHGLRARWGGADPLQLQAVVDGLSAQPVGRSPGFADLALAVDGIGERFAVQLRGEPARFDWPSSLREVMHPQVTGDLLLWRAEDATWCLSALQLALGEADYAIDATGDLCFDEGAPRVDLRLTVAPTPVVTAKKFWIIDRMPAAAVDWLDAALVDGQIVAGALQLHGDLAHWPFRDGGGRFEALAQLHDVTLAYRPDWPAGRGLGGSARFLNDGMEVELQAEVAGIVAQRVTGGIERFRHALLHLDVVGHGKGPAMLGFLRASPLWPRLAAGLAAVDIQGDGELTLALDIPLKQGGPPPVVDGRVRFDAADLRHADFGIAFDAARGEVRFSERGVLVEDMEVLHASRPARFGLAVGSFALDPAHQVEAQLAGRLDAHALLDSQPDLAWLKSYLRGASAWRIALAVPQAGAPPRLRLDSDLVGTTLSLPAPLRKSAATPMALALGVDLAATGKHIDLQLGELLHLRGVLREDQPFNGVAAFGDAPGIERPVRGIAVQGQVPVLDTGGWSALAAGVGGEGSLHSVDLQCGELDVLGRPFSETRIGYVSSASGKTVILDGPGLAGEIEIPAAVELAQRGITARFERLYWPAASDVVGSDSAGSIDPRLVPALHLHANDLRLGGASLGDTRLETFPTLDGLRVEQFAARSPALELSARGDWNRGVGGERSEFSVEFTAQDLGAMLQALGFAEFVEGGQTLATLKAHWPGPPSAFSLAAAEGELGLSVGKGRIPDVDPGAGRLFGLLNLSLIPRRLALDFSDFFRAGLAFDRIDGHFRLGGGHADTDDLRIDGPAAEIRIRGRTGLRDQSYTQTMEVLPRAGSVLPVVGGLAAGPAGIALGAVAQAVLQQPFKQMTRTLYRVEGPWNAPRVEVIERGPAGNAPAPADPPPPG